MTPADLLSRTEVFLQTRPRLFAAAYRLLGSVTDTEDILQEAFLRWQSAAPQDLHNTGGYLMRITTRLCLDHLKSARVQREIYPGNWLPEPVPTDDPIAELDHDISLALLLALEKLTPLERAAFLLHDVFDCGYDEIAATLQRSEQSCRQLATRARRNVRQDKPRSQVDRDHGQAIAQAFFRATKSGDLSALTQLLTQDAVLMSDGGGKALATLNPILGRDKIMRFYGGLARKLAAHEPRPWRECELNGMPAILSHEADGHLQATALELVDGRIERIYAIRNPDKTQHLAELLPLG